MRGQGKNILFAKRKSVSAPSTEELAEKEKEEKRQAKEAKKKLKQDRAARRAPLKEEDFLKAWSSRSKHPPLIRDYQISEEEWQEIKQSKTTAGGLYKTRQLLHPSGSRVKLIQMQEHNFTQLSPFPGEEGTILNYDDGTNKVNVDWDNGSKLALIDGDEFIHI